MWVLLRKVHREEPQGTLSLSIVQAGPAVKYKDTSGRFVGCSTLLHLLSNKLQSYMLVGMGLTAPISQVGKLVSES